jgi:hypothetical protein
MTMCAVLRLDCRLLRQADHHRRMQPTIGWAGFFHVHLAAGYTTKPPQTVKECPITLWWLVR